MSLFKVEIDRNQADTVEHRVINQVDRYNQKFWLYRSGIKFPAEYVLSLPDGVKVIPEGFYVLDIASELDKARYGSLTITAYPNYKLQPISQDAFNKFADLERAFIDSILNPSKASAFGALPAKAA